MPDGFAPGVLLVDLIPLLFAALIGCFIGAGYVFVQSGDPSRFRIANACVILTVVICLITRVVDDLATAFIVVGALTLVRLRAAIEDTKEFGFLLLAVAAGLGVGERHYAIAAAGAALVCLLAALLTDRSGSDLEHRLSAVLPENEIGALRERILASRIGHRLRIRDAGEGRVSVRADFTGQPALADDLMAWLRTRPGVEDLRYEAETRRDR